MTGAGERRGAAGSEEIALSRWREQVRRDLRGAEPESLRWCSPDGVELEPLYVDGPSAGGLPGAPPFLRGSERTHGWRVVHEPIGRSGAALIESARRALAEGADAIWLGPDAAPSLEGELGALAALGAPVFLEGSARLAAAWLERPAGEPLTVLRDPLGDVARGAPAAELDAAFAEVAGLVGRARAERPSARPLLVSARAYAEGGASAVDELALLVASGIECLRALEGAGHPLADGPLRVLFEVALDADFFVGIAKLRAARLLWSKVLRTLGIDGPEQGMRLAARAARRGTSLVDPQTNVLRGTAAAFAAAVGGAELVTILPYDELTGAPSAHAERLARNTQLVLREEARLGAVLDPAGGSYFLETLTDRLARGAWREMQEIEHLGGVARGLSDGSVAERARAGAEARRRAAATRARGLVGVSRYPSPEVLAPAEAGPTAFAIAPRRDAEPYEALRRRAAALPDEARRALVFGVGEPRALGPRVDFARDVLEVAGLCVEALAVRERAEDALAALPASLPAVVVPCAADGDYAAALEALAPALRERGARAIVAATREVDALSALADVFVHRGADLPRALGAVLDAAEGGAR